MSNYPSKEQVQELMEYVGNNLHLPQLIQHFDKSNIYDTNEKLVGQWIDGKPLYQKTYMPTQGYGAGTNTIVSNFISTLNVDRLVNMVGLMYRDDNNPYTYVISNTAITGGDYCYIDSDGSLKFMKESTSYSAWKLHITLQYTKTTDTALTYKIGTDEDYSTDERLVGTWGNLPLYKKTISFGTLPDTTSKEVNTGLSNVMVRVIEGYAYRPSDGVTIPLPLAGTTSASHVNMSIRNNGAQIRISTGQDRTDMTNSYVTLYYTKNS